MTLGKMNSAESFAWLHTEPPGIGHGRRVFVRVYRLTLLVEVEILRRNEWTIYVSLHSRMNNWLRLDIGPGVIPF